MRRECLFSRGLAGALAFVLSVVVVGTSRAEVVVPSAIDTAQLDVIERDVTLFAEGEVVEKKFTGSLGADLNTHFMSYGFDVWGAGNNWGSRGTLNVWGDFNVDLDIVNLNFGIWADYNNNAANSLGGNVQEVDVYVGVTLPFSVFEAGDIIDRASVGLTYQEWYYGGQTEKIVDISLAFDDTDLIMEGFALNPSVVFHFRTQGAGLGEGLAVVIGVEPSIDVLESDSTPISVSFPVSVGFGDSTFYGSSGYAFFSAGATVSMGMNFIPAEYGAWSASASVAWYNTDPAAIGNPQKDTITGRIGIAVDLP